MADHALSGVRASLLILLVGMSAGIAITAVVGALNDRSNAAWAKLQAAAPAAQRLLLSHPWMTDEHWANAIGTWYDAAKREGTSSETALDLAVYMVDQGRMKNEMCLPAQLSPQKKAEVLAKRGLKADDLAISIACTPL